jgi:uncharacterized protein YjbI with pentapeptide repeats
VALRKKAGEEVDLSHANLIGLHLSETDLSFVNLAYARLGDCSQYDEGLGVGHLGTELRGANLTSAILLGAHLCGADIRAADLEGAQVTEDQIQSAKGDLNTRVSIERPSRWFSTSEALPEEDRPISRN